MSTEGMPIPNVGATGDAFAEAFDPMARGLRRLVETPEPRVANELSLRGIGSARFDTLSA